MTSQPMQVTKQCFKEFSVRQVAAAQAVKEIKSYSQFDKVYHIYNSMAELGKSQINLEMQNKSAQQIQGAIKQLA